MQAISITNLQTSLSKAAPDTTTGHPKEDVFITLLENQEIDWSFGNGVAQLAC